MLSSIPSLTFSGGSSSADFSGTNTSGNSGRSGLGLFEIIGICFLSLIGLIVVFKVVK